MRNVLVRHATEQDTPRSGSGSPPSVPRWVKVLAIIAVVLFLLFVILRFTVIPYIHSLGGQTPPASVLTYGGQQP